VMVERKRVFKHATPRRPRRSWKAWWVWLGEHSYWNLDSLGRLRETRTWSNVFPVLAW